MATGELGSEQQNQETIRLVAELKGELVELQRVSSSFGTALGDALEDGIVKGGSLGDVLRSLGARLSSIALSSALKPVETAFGSVFGTLTRGALGGVAPPIVGGGLSTPATLGGGLAPVQPAVAAQERAASAPRASPVTVNIATPDPESFRRAEAQVTASLARAVSRGRRGL